MVGADARRLIAAAVVVVVVVVGGGGGGGTIKGSLRRRMEVSGLEGDNSLLHFLLLSTGVGMVAAG